LKTEKNLKHDIVKPTKGFELKPRLVCKKCGREVLAEGRYIHHRSGTISFLIYNADRACIWCRMERGKIEVSY